MNKNFDNFIKKANKKHNNKYDYSKVNYINSQTKVCIICPEHGEFWQTPAAHIRGNACPLCSNKKRGIKTTSTEILIKKYLKVHQNKYSYKKTEYINPQTKIIITCPIHGDFEQLPYAHLNGQGCPKCNGKFLNTSDIIHNFKCIHGDRYDYSKVEYKGSKEKVCIICPEHGEFWQTPYKHLQGQKCPLCANQSKKLDSQHYIDKANQIHQYKYIYNNDINGYNSKITIICPIHGEFNQNSTNHLQGCGCPKCSNTISQGEDMIKNYIESLNFNVISKNRDILNGKELDIYITEKKIAIEFDGLRWHNEQFGKDCNYHLNKTIECEKKGIRLIHIFEDEWRDKQEIVKSRLCNILGVSKTKIFGRKCKVKEIPSKDSSQFLNENHIQGNVNAKYRYGLYYNDELVSVMTFGKTRKCLNSVTEDKYELLRFCNKLNTFVIGGASKLLKYFINEVHPKSIVSYADKRWSDGNLYRMLGFKYIHDSKPNYFYIIKGKRFHRYGFRKDILVKKYNCPKEMSEHEFCLSQKWYRIYDCGTMKFEMNIPQE